MRISKLLPTPEPNHDDTHPARRRPPILREGLRNLLEQQPDCDVIGQATNGREAVNLARKLTPDLCVMDVSMPELNGIEATRQIRRDNDRVKVIALSMHSDASFVGRALEAGAAGYLLKDCAYEELKKAVEDVLAGRVYLSPGISSPSSRSAKA